MKGFVPTPAAVVDLMVAKLFDGHPPTRESTLLDPGCGRGAFIEGVVRWCVANQQPLPTIIGVDSDPAHVAVAAERFAGLTEIEIRHADFLASFSGRFDYIVGNPPYVPITALSTAERTSYRNDFTTARGRFDLYLLFFEKALRLLAPAGRLVLITPEKYLYVDTARPLRSLLQQFRMHELHFLNEQTFGKLVTYPLVSTVFSSPPRSLTRVIGRDGRANTVRLDASSSSWLPPVLGREHDSVDLRLADICTRVSCGVATGADAVYVVRDIDLEPELLPFAYRTVSGRQLFSGQELKTVESLLIPYAPDGQLLPERNLGPLGRYVAAPARHGRLLSRTCVARKPWYAFHESPPMVDLLRPKILCKDITSNPFFVVDRLGEIVPRHSVYYIVPADTERVDDLSDYLNSSGAEQWLRGHCQRAANGFLRLQSHVLKELPVPSSFATSQTALVAGARTVEYSRA